MINRAEIMQTLDLQGVWLRLKDACAAAGSQADWGRQHGIPATTVSAAFVGIPAKSVLRALGLRVKTVYEVVG